MADTANKEIHLYHARLWEEFLQCCWNEV